MFDPSHVITTAHQPLLTPRTVIPFKSYYHRSARHLDSNLLLTRNTSFPSSITLIQSMKYKIKSHLSFNFSQLGLSPSKNERPLTALVSSEIIHKLQRVDEPRIFDIVLCPMAEPVRHNYEFYCAMVDSHISSPSPSPSNRKFSFTSTNTSTTTSSEPPSNPSSPVPPSDPSSSSPFVLPYNIPPSDPNAPVSHHTFARTQLRLNHMATPPKPPTFLPGIWANLYGQDHHHHWIQATHTQYAKNQKINICAITAPRELIPTGNKVLQSLLAVKIKNKGNYRYEFITRLCDNGSS